MGWWTVDNFVDCLVLYDEVLFIAAFDDEVLIVLGVA